MIIDKKGNLFEDRRKEDRRKNTFDANGGRRKEDRRKSTTTQVVNKDKK